MSSQPHYFDYPPNQPEIGADQAPMGSYRFTKTAPELIPIDTDKPVLAEVVNSQERARWSPLDGKIPKSPATEKDGKKIAAKELLPNRETLLTRLNRRRGIGEIADRTGILVMYAIEFTQPDLGFREYDPDLFMQEIKGLSQVRPHSEDHARLLEDKKRSLSLQMIVQDEVEEAAALAVKYETAQIKEIQDATARFVVKAALGSGDYVRVPGLKAIDAISRVDVVNSIGIRYADTVYRMLIAKHLDLGTYPSLNSQKSPQLRPV